MGQNSITVAVTGKLGLELIWKWHEDTFRDNGNILYLHRGFGYTGEVICLKLGNVHLIFLHFILFQKT